MTTVSFNWYAGLFGSSFSIVLHPEVDGRDPLVFEEVFDEVGSITCSGTPSVLFYDVDGDSRRDVVGSCSQPINTGISSKLIWFSTNSEGSLSSSMELMSAATTLAMATAAGNLFVAHGNVVQRHVEGSLFETVATFTQPESIFGLDVAQDFILMSSLPSMTVCKRNSTCQQVKNTEILQLTYVSLLLAEPLQCWRTTTPTGILMWYIRQAIALCRFAKMSWPPTELF